MTIDFNQVLKVEIREPTEWSAWKATLVGLCLKSGWITKPMTYGCIMVCNENPVT